jgi:hypothetical protein
MEQALNKLRNSNLSEAREHKDVNSANPKAKASQHHAPAELLTIRSTIFEGTAC